MFGLFAKKQDDTPAQQLFFSILLSEKLVQAALWTIDNGLVYIKTKSTLKPYFNEADCLVKLDECLQELGSDGEHVNQTIFHLDSSFADEHGIYAEKKVFFKNMLGQLQLTSIGFVSNIEAVIGSRLEEEENAAHHLIIEFTKQNTIFALFEGKILLDMYRAENSVNLTTQFNSALEQFKENLDLSTLEMLSVTLISALYSTEELTTKEPNFPTALPLKFAYIGSDILLPIVAVPGATAIAKAKGWLKPALEIADEDIAPAAVVATQTGAIPTVEEATAQVNEEEFVSSRVKPKKPIKKLPAKPFIIAGVAVGVLVALLVVSLIFLQQTVATLTIEPKTQLLSKNIKVTIDPSADKSDYDNLILTGELVEEELTDEVKINTTGTKEVGEKAKGTVILTNKRNQKRELKSGTELTSGNLTFALIDDITVEPCVTKTDSDGATTCSESTKKEANVTAQEIGEKGNLTAKTSLKVAAYNTDELEANAKDNFFGGTNKEVKVIANSDLTKALKEVTESLGTKAKELDKKTSGKYYVPLLGDLTITKKTYSGEAGEEADELTLTVTADVPVIAYDKEDLKPLALVVLEKEVPTGYSLTGEPELMSAVDNDGASASDTLVLQADLSSVATANLDFDALRPELLGQALLKVQNLLTSNEAIKAYELKWSNNLYPKLFDKLPTKADKLQLTLYNSGQ